MRGALNQFQLDAQSFERVVDFEATSDGAASLTFSGLDIDAWGELQMEVYFAMSASASLLCKVNGEASVSTPTTYMLSRYTGTRLLANANTETLLDVMGGGDGGDGYTSCARLIMRKVGSAVLSISKSLESSSGSVVSRIFNYVHRFVYSNNITSLVVFPSTGVIKKGTRIVIYRRLP